MQLVECSHIVNYNFLYIPTNCKSFKATVFVLQILLFDFGLKDKTN
jgi:hypothetical protein